MPLRGMNWHCRGPPPVIEFNSWEGLAGSVNGEGDRTETRTQRIRPSRRLLFRRRHEGALCHRYPGIR